MEKTKEETLRGTQHKEQLKKELDEAWEAWEKFWDDWEAWEKER